jgi:hypothetical protein
MDKKLEARITKLEKLILEDELSTNIASLENDLDRAQSLTRFLKLLANRYNSESCEKASKLFGKACKALEDAINNRLR